VRYGPTFKPPSKNVLRKARQAGGAKMFEAAEIRAMLADAVPQMKAMVLLGINCGFGNSDIAGLPHAALDLERGWVDYPRPKTAVPRRCPLWPETISAIREALAVMPRPKNASDAAFVFINSYGNPWTNRNSRDPVSVAFTRFIKKLNLHRPGLGFYGLRQNTRDVHNSVSKGEPACRDSVCRGGMGL